MKSINKEKITVTLEKKTKMRALTFLRGEPPQLVISAYNELSDGREINLESLKIPFSPTEKIKILSPETAEETGEVLTHQDIFNIVYSIFYANTNGKDLKELD